MERFPSIENNKKLANEHALPLTTMLSCESVFDFERQTEEESVIKKNRLMLEKTIVRDHKFNNCLNRLKGREESKRAR